MTVEDFPDLVERARQLTNEVCEKAKPILRRLLPDMETLQGNASFSPRLMLLMLTRTGEQLSESDHEALRIVLQFAEEFRPTLVGWMIAIKGSQATAGSRQDVEACRRAIELLAAHSVDLDRLLARVVVDSRAS